MKLVLCLIGLISLTGCTLMVGNNKVGHVAPRGSYRSVDTTGENNRPWQDMEGGGEVAPETTVE